MTNADNGPVAYRRTRTASRREERIQVYYTPEEKAAVTAAAKKVHKAAGAWLGMLGISAARDKQLPAGDALAGLMSALQELATEAGRQGRNLNQITARINAAGQVDPGTGHELRHAIARNTEVQRDINDAMSRVRDVLG